MQAKRTLKRVAFLGAAGAAGMTMAGVGAGLAAWSLWRRMRRGESLAGQVALITGATRGLGLGMARELAREGARLAICGRDRDELDWAREELSHGGAEVLAIQCDVGSHDDVQRMVRTTLEHYGRIDVLINNAGIITVGPFETQTMTDYQEAMDTMFWGVVYPTLAVLPHMMARRSGRIGNVTSIGGKISVPHLLPYNCAKFAAVGFSEGLHAEVKRYGIQVTTIVPGLMRTGSFVNAWFKGKNRAEYGWFSVSSALPVLAMNGRRAARTIVSAIRRGDTEITLTPQAKLLAVMNGVFPAATAELLALANRLLPTADGVAHPFAQREVDARGEQPGGEHPRSAEPAAWAQRHLGKDSESAVSDSLLTRFGRDAARDFHQYPERRRSGGPPQPIASPA